jgi:predicted N-formylglutamate amidohydrolase
MFRGREHLLASHRGWDPGALRLAQHFSRTLDAPLVHAEVSRLVVELNRSEGHPDLFSPFMKHLDTAQRETVLNQYYRPHRQRIRDELSRMLEGQQPVLHLSVHTFTPVRNGVRRNTTVGLLYDPQRPREKAFCDRWAGALRAARPRLTIKRNNPYRGSDDGLTTSLRQQFGDAPYLGVELELSQAVVRRKDWFASLAPVLSTTLIEVLSTTC